ncbi:MAG: hypothetical protein ACO2PK_04985 [Armatimonadota bacterium]
MMAENQLEGGGDDDGSPSRQAVTGNLGALSRRSATNGMRAMCPSVVLIGAFG